MAEPRSNYIYDTAELVLSSMGVVVNFATMCAILLSKALRKEQNIFTFNLALADCTSAFALVIIAFDKYTEVRYNIIICRVYRLLKAILPSF